MALDSPERGRSSILARQRGGERAPLLPRCHFSSLTKTPSATEPFAACEAEYQWFPSILQVCRHLGFTSASGEKSWRHRYSLSALRRRSHPAKCRLCSSKRRAILLELFQTHIPKAAEFSLSQFYRGKKTRLKLLTSTQCYLNPFLEQLEYHFPWYSFHCETVFSTKKYLWSY